MGLFARDVLFMNYFYITEVKNNGIIALGKLHSRIEVEYICEADPMLSGHSEWTSFLGWLSQVKQMKGKRKISPQGKTTGSACPRRTAGQHHRHRSQQE